MFVIDLLLRNMAFCEFVAMYTTCRTSFPFKHIRSMETFLLNIMSSAGFDVLKRNGGTEDVKPFSQFWKILSRSFRTWRVAFSGGCSFA